MTHESYCDSSSFTQKSPGTEAAIAFHWSSGASLLNEKLSKYVDPSERDALWATAGLLGALAFSSLSATAPSEAWPLKPASPFDLDWLKMTEGKKAIWKIADPTRKDSVFYPHVPDIFKDSSSTSSSTETLQNLPPELVRLCGLSHIFSLDLGQNLSEELAGGSSCNPYFATAFFLASTLTTASTAKNLSMFLKFFGTMQPPFKELLKQKDPCAMLLLTLWYCRLCECPLWWSWRRAHFESRAICAYLSSHPVHSMDVDIIGVVCWLKLKCCATTVALH